MTAVDFITLFAIPSLRRIILDALVGILFLTVSSAYLAGVSWVLWVYLRG